jgi:hypothetical protein
MLPYRVSMFAVLMR